MRGWAKGALGQGLPGLRHQALWAKSVASARDWKCLLYSAVASLECILPFEQKMCYFHFATTMRQFIPLSYSKDIHLPFAWGWNFFFSHPRNQGSSGNYPYKALSPWLCLSCSSATQGFQTQEHLDIQKEGGQSTNASSLQSWKEHSQNCNTILRWQSPVTFCFIALTGSRNWSCMPTCKPADKKSFFKKTCTQLEAGISIFPLSRKKH